MTEISEKVQEYLDNAVFRRSEEKNPKTNKQTNKQTARLDCDTKDQRERRLQLRRHAKQSRWAGGISQENQQLRLQRRRKHKRARLECETPEQSAKTSNTKTAKSRTKGKTESRENQQLCLQRRREQRRARLETSVHMYGLLCFRGCKSFTKKTNEER